MDNKEVFNISIPDLKFILDCIEYAREQTEESDKMVLDMWPPDNKLQAEILNELAEFVYKATKDECIIAVCNARVQSKACANKNY